MGSNGRQQDQESGRRGAAKRRLGSRRLRFKFWGVRGSIPTPQAENLEYGGNTACLEVRYGDEPPLVFDAGSGIRRLGLDLKREFERQRVATVFLTHFHWDHIQGLPFFWPLYQPGLEVAFHSALAPARLERILERQMATPYFPVPWSAAQARRRYVQVEGRGIRLGDLRVRPFPLHHPGGAVGYRIEAPDCCIVFATDLEHGDERHDAILRQHARDADVLIFDAQFTPEEYKRRRGWGHSTWLEGTQVARATGTGRLILFHHDPEHDDRAVARIVARAAAEFPRTMAAREGWAMCL